jgi:ElaB/YqjD/DUF883 family membrane-anchored ribosome-binding protein
MREPPYETTGEAAQNRPEGDDQREELREEIQKTREELGETVEALTEKADVKTQARDKLAEGKQALRDKASQLGQTVQRATPDQAQHVLGQAIGEARQRPMSAGIAFLLGVLLGLVFKKQAPKAGRRKKGWQQAVSSAALQAAIFGGVKAVADRGGTEKFRKLMSTWPGR